MAVLRVLEGDTARPEYELGEETSIGRGEDNDIRIFDETSSRRHAAVVRRDGAFWLRDLGSSNGTFLRGERVDESELADGDDIAVGSVRFRFLLAGGASHETVLLADGASCEVHSSIEEGAPAAGPGGEGGAPWLRKALEIQAHVARTLDPEEIMDRLNEALLTHIGGDRSAVLSASAEGDVEPLAVRRSRKEGRKPFILSRAIVEEVVRNRRSFLLEDPRQDPLVGGRESILDQNVSTALCVPVVEGDRVAALLYLDRTGDSPPFTEDELRLAVAVAEQVAPAIRNARAFSRLSQHARNLEKAGGGEMRLVGEAPAFAEVVDMARRVAASDATVLIAGETGTGKELLARLIHQQSGRRGAPFVAVNCAALVGTLLESELFGHEKGAFTGAQKRKPGRFELADGGTLFLDEIGEMPADVQAKLLRALQEKAFYRVGGTVPVEVDIRIVAATNRNLAERIEAGGFRADLYYRLSVVTVEVPPLRERRSDIPDLARHFLRLSALKTGRPVEGFSAEAQEKLAAYDWPGNVRELQNIIERAVVLSTRPVVDAELIPVSAAPAARAGGTGDVITLKEAERRAIVAALRHTGGKKGETAKILGISWPTLNKKINDYGIEV